MAGGAVAVTTAYDNSTLHDFKVCMRMGYFKHVRKWTSASKSPALIFGSAWHSAMDVVWGGLTQGGVEFRVVDEAKSAFTATWEEAVRPTFPSRT